MYTGEASSLETCIDVMPSGSRPSQSGKGTPLVQAENSCCKSWIKPPMMGMAGVKGRAKDGTAADPQEEKVVQEHHGQSELV